MMVQNLMYLVSLIGLLQSCDGANILCIFPMPSFSHQQPMLALSRALAKNGHNLTVITPNPSKIPIPNHRDVDISFMYGQWGRFAEEEGVSLQEEMTPIKMIQSLPAFQRFFSKIVLESPQYQNLIRELNGTKFNLILYEALHFTSLLGIKELIGNPPVIGISTFNPFTNTDMQMGNPILSSYLPNSFLPNDHMMTFWERMYNLYITAYIYYQLRVYMIPHQEILLKKHFGNTKQTVEQLELTKSLLIVSADLGTLYPRPVQCNTVYVGPMHIQSNVEPMQAELKKWTDEAQHGVIFFSMGSNVKGTSLDPSKREAFIKAFSKFPHMRFVWKFEAEQLPGKPDNVLIWKWIPQQSLLAHPNVKLFITQLGLQSFQEAIYNQVPMLGIPVHGDQLFHARKLVQSGAGLRIEFSKVTSENIYDSLQELLTNSSFKENIRTLSSITRDKPMTPIETAVWWTEYVIRHKGAVHLRPAALELNWFQHYSVDIIVALISSVILVLYLTNYLLEKLSTSVRPKKKKSKRN